MGISQSMKALTENIIASYDMRAREIGEIASDANKILAGARGMVKGFKKERQAMAGAQREKLKNFAKDLTKTVQGRLKETRNKLKEIAENRADAREELKAKLKKEAKDLKSYVNRKLKDFAEDREDMSENLKKNLADTIKKIKGAVGEILHSADKLIKDYRADFKSARTVWGNMTSSLSKERKGAVQSPVKKESGEKATSAEEPIEAKTTTGKTGKKKAKKKKR